MAEVIEKAAGAYLQLLAAVAQVEVAEARETQDVPEIGRYVVGQQIGHDQVSEARRQASNVGQQANARAVVPLVGAAVGQVEVLESASRVKMYQVSQ